MTSSADILGAKILVVDDKEAHVRLLEHMLHGAGFLAVQSTTDSREVCELHRTNRYDLILLDLEMPGMDGFEVMESLKRSTTDDYPPVLVITAQPGHKLRALEAGARDFINKPVDRVEMLARIRNMLKVHLLHMEAKRHNELLQQTVQERTAHLRAQEALFGLAVESCPSGMVMIDRFGKIAMVNSAVERMFGYGREEMIGQPVDMLVPERLRAQYVRDRDEFFAKAETRRLSGAGDFIGLRKNGAEFPVELGLNPIPTNEGLLALSVIVDISERKRVELLKDELVSTVSHELRTPLTSIAGSLGLLVGNAMGIKLPESIAHLLTIAYTNSQRLVRLIDDMLDLDKIASGNVDFQLQRVEIHSLVQQCIEANLGFAETYGVRIRLEAASATGDVRADRDRLVQVVTNLLSNAVKFSPAGQEVVVTIENNADTVRISVRDHGPGIPEGFKNHIFEKFAQAAGSNALHKGSSGLGLSIVKEIVTRLDGRVDFDDAPGGGTIFRVELPSWQHVTNTKSTVDGAAHGPGSRFDGDSSRAVIA